MSGKFASFSPCEVFVALRGSPRRRWAALPLCTGHIILDSPLRVAHAPFCLACVLPRTTNGLRTASRKASLRRIFLQPCWPYLRVLAALLESATSSAQRTDPLPEPRPVRVGCNPLSPTTAQGPSLHLASVPQPCRLAFPPMWPATPYAARKPLTRCRQDTPRRWCSCRPSLCVRNAEGRTLMDWQRRRGPVLELVAAPPPPRLHQRARFPAHRTSEAVLAAAKSGISSWALLRARRPGGGNCVRTGSAHCIQFADRPPSLVANRVRAQLVRDTRSSSRPGTC